MTGRGPLAGQRCVVAGGAGAVGEMFVSLFHSAGASVCVIEPGPADGIPAWDTRHVGDITDPNARLLAELGSADIVMLAVPETVALLAVSRVVTALSPGAMLVDTLSVKTAIVQAVAALPMAVEFVSLNPMFAPSLGLRGRPVAAVVAGPGPRSQSLLDLLRGQGSTVVEVTAEEHDRLAAAVQALTHASILGFGLALAELTETLNLGPDQVAAVAPPPFVLLSALLARVTGGTPATYWDIQTANPYAATARTALRTGLDRLEHQAAPGRQPEFEDTVAGLARLLGPALPQLRRHCAAAFEVLAPIQATPASAPSVRTTHRSGLVERHSG